ncbi:MAG TPA: sulfite exporter TauE/SafE family protein [Candidatus Limnocylindrales bacterium]|jgi:hypothetical protein
MDVGLLMLGGGVVAGIFGSLLGLGGGVLIVPLLTIGFGLPVRDAVGVSLICVIMTSGASASVYLERQVANLRLGMLLELFTATGAVIGGAIAFLLDPRILEGLFAVLLVYTAWTMLSAARRRPVPAPADVPDGADPVADSTNVVDGSGSAPVAEAGAVAATAVEAVSGDHGPFVARLAGPGYGIRRLRPAAVLSVFAGIASALLGIGGGLIKVPVMHLVMGIPLRVATATSNLMIGITGSTSAIVYLLRGGINPFATAPTAVGVFLGASVGSRLAHRIDVRVLRLLFVLVLLYTAFEMARKAMGAA